MDDGYYLSTYLNPAGAHRMANVRFRHDENLALWRLDGNRLDLIAHWELERISGQKGHRTPFRTVGEQKSFLANLLRDFDVSLDEVREIWGTPGIRTGDDRFLSELSNDLAFHSIAHLYSAVLMDSDRFFTGRILGLAVDFAPDLVLDGGRRPNSYAGCYVDTGAIELFPVESPGALYCAARDKFGLREGTLMALATASTATAEFDLERTTDDVRWFGHRGTVEAADHLIGEFVNAAEHSITPDPRFSSDECTISAVMKLVQDYSFQIMKRNVDTAIDRFGFNPGSTFLALAGGSALNCPTNSRLVTEYGFRGLSAPPSVADDGQSVGIGLAVFHTRMSGRFDFRYPSPYLGPAVATEPDPVAEFSEFVRSRTAYSPDIAVSDLFEGPVVWVDGRSEVGPRALGHRSILADPRTRASKDRLNAIKQRQWWRPVAPVVLFEEGRAWFDGLRESPYMLETFTLHESSKDRVEAISHLDDSARVQTVGSDEGRIVEVLKAFHRRTGVPMLCNTSLNDSGEPIIESVRDALNFALRKKIRVVYAHGIRIELQAHDDYVGYAPGMRSRDWFTLDERDRRDALAQLNPYKLNDTELYVYLTADVDCRVDIRTESGATQAQAFAQRMFAHNEMLADMATDTMRKNAEYFRAFGTYPLVVARRFGAEYDDAAAE